VASAGTARRTDTDADGGMIAHMRSINAQFAPLLAATLLTAAPAFADARKSFVGVCEGVAQLVFFY
jgi:hypothetical protein